MKPKYKIHPVMLFALFVNTVILGAIAFNHFMADNLGFGYLFMFFAVVFGTMVYAGIKHNRNFDKDKR